MKELYRFLVAQEKTYDIALKEMKKGFKESHWMWFIFPQLKGLGSSVKADFYGIQDKAEAEAYLKHPILGNRLREITTILLQISSNDPEEVMGYPDNLKLKSSMTLFYLVSGEALFMDVLNKFYDGILDEKTCERL